jgi:hypothetical protein
MAFIVLTIKKNAQPQRQPAQHEQDHIDRVHVLLEPMLVGVSEPPSPDVDRLARALDPLRELVDHRASILRAVVRDHPHVDAVKMYLLNIGLWINLHPYICRFENTNPVYMRVKKGLSRT